MNYPTITVAAVETLAAQAHHTQTDKSGKPYFEHVRAVADGVTPFGDDMRMAGLLHDIVEDTPWTLDDLARAGVPAHVRDAVAAVTRPTESDAPERPSYQRWIENMVERERSNRDGMVPARALAALGLREGAVAPRALLLKLSDNAHNSRSDRKTPGQDMSRRYSRARAALLSAIDVDAARIVLGRVNPDLLSELG